MPYEYQQQLSGIPLISEHVLVVNPYNSSCRTWTMWGGVCRGLARGTLSTRETEWDPPPLLRLSSQGRQEMPTIYNTVFVQDKLPSSAQMVQPLVQRRTLSTEQQCHAQKLASCFVL